MFDALPILAAAKDVTIAEIPEQNTERADALSHVADVAGWLRGHGIAANTLVPEAATGVAVTEQLDRIAANVGAGAVIAGAYGHSRFREWILGGVTRHLATESGRCAFLSRTSNEPSPNHALTDGRRIFRHTNGRNGLC